MLKYVLSLTELLRTNNSNSSRGRNEWWNIGFEGPKGWTVLHFIALVVEHQPQMWLNAQDVNISRILALMEQGVLEEWRESTLSHKITSLINKAIDGIFPTLIGVV